MRALRQLRAGHDLWRASATEPWRGGGQIDARRGGRHRSRRVDGETKRRR
jgi:hypothetical protein